MNIYIGNLPSDVSEKDLILAFDPFGSIASALIIMDRATGKSKCFGFVDIPDENEAQAAIDGMNGKDLKGKTINVDKARPRAINHRRDGGQDSFGCIDNRRY